MFATLDRNNKKWHVESGTRLLITFSNFLWFAIGMILYLAMAGKSMSMSKTTSIYCCSQNMAMSITSQLGHCLQDKVNYI